MGWNGSGEKGAVKHTPQERKPPRFLKGALAGLLVVIATAGAWYFLAPNGQKPIKEKAEGNRQILEVKPSLPPKPAPAPEAKKEEPPPEDPATKRVKTLTFVTNTMGNVIERYQTADGKVHKVIRPSRPPIFHHVTDDILSMALAQNDSGPIPPIPFSGDMDKDFLKSIEEPIIIEEGDSEEIKQRKKIVREARLEVKKLMDQGMHFQDIIADHTRLMNENAEIRSKAIADARKIRDEGDTEGTAEYVSKMNEAFKSMGIEEIEMPKSKEERKAEREARRAAAREAREAKAKENQK